MNLFKKSPGSSKGTSSDSAENEKTPKDSKKSKSKKAVWKKIKFDKIAEEGGNDENLMSPSFQSKNEGYGPDGPNLFLGFPILHVSFSVLKFFIIIAIILLITSFIFFIKLFISSIQIRAHIGYYINMVSQGDGDILPSLQAVPTLLYFLFDLNATYVVYKLFDSKRRPKLNFYAFISIVVGLFLIILTLGLIIAIIAHIYNEHLSLHDGMKDAMQVYATDSIAKSQVDQLQIEFQCCGSMKYEEWYDIKWYDSGLVNGEELNKNDSNTPFSCCSVSSIYPCIHYDIEKTGHIYQYTPEYNLSISTSGCYDILIENKQKVGWVCVGNLFLIIILQLILLAMIRFLQTAHFEKLRFDSSHRKYTIWLIGYYKGKTDRTSPPAPPPVPPELKD